MALYDGTFYVLFLILWLNLANINVLLLMVQTDEGYLTFFDLLHHSNLNFPLNNEWPIDKLIVSSIQYSWIVTSQFESSMKWDKSIK